MPGRFFTYIRIVFYEIQSMKIIIAGDGETGTHLARMLSVENQDIVLIGENREHLAELDAEGNFITSEGRPTSAAALERCGVGSADLFVAVTPDENTNIVACELAREIGAAKCAARVDSPEFTDGVSLATLRRHGVDLAICPEKLAAGEISQFICHNWASQWFPLRRGELLVAGVRMEPGGELCGKTLRDIPSNPRLFHVAAIRRGSAIIIPRGDDSLLAGDTIYFVVRPEDTGILPRLCGRREIPVRRIMISGGGRVTENLLEIIAGGHYNITVIDPDRERCHAIASRFPRVVAVNAAASDVLTLKEEGIEKCDIFLALTGSSETNIVSCMVAREHGAPRTLARIEELEYIPEAESLSIDKIINKKLINAGSILNAILESDRATSQCVSLENAEIAGITVREGSKIVSKPIAGLSLPKGITVGGLIRDGRGQIVEGRTRVEPGDHVVVFCVAGTLPKVQRYFS